MKNIKNLLILITIIVSVSTITKAQDAAVGLTGNWTLDKSKTNIKDLPRELKDYKMIINHSEKKLLIKNIIEGTINPRFDNNTSNNDAAKSRDGIWGDSRAGTGVSIKPNYSGSMALSKYFSPNEEAFNLDGKEIEIDVVQGGSKVGSAKVKAKEEKAGKSVKANTIRKMKTSKSEQSEMIVYVREKWDLSEDGNSLKYIKTIELPNVTDEVILFFSKSSAVQ